MDPRLSQFFAVVKGHHSQRPMAMRVKVVGNSPMLQTVVINRSGNNGSTRFTLLPSEELQDNAMFVGVGDDGIYAYRDWNYGDSPHRPDKATPGMIRHRTPPIIGLFTEAADAYGCVIYTPTDHRPWDARWHPQTADVLQRIHETKGCSPLILSTKLHELLGSKNAKPQLVQ